MGVNQLKRQLPIRFGLEEFFDVQRLNKKPGTKIMAGRAWAAEELRLKSNEDLHKLWWILWKERNMLYSEKLAARSKGASLDNPGRIGKVRKSMARLKSVLGERGREYKRLKEEVEAPFREAKQEQRVSEANKKRWEKYTAKRIKKFAAIDKQSSEATTTGVGV